MHLPFFPRCRGLTSSTAPRATTQYTPRLLILSGVSLAHTPTGASPFCHRGHGGCFPCLPITVKRLRANPHGDSRGCCRTSSGDRSTPSLLIATRGRSALSRASCQTTGNFTSRSPLDRRFPFLAQTRPFPRQRRPCSRPGPSRCAQCRQPRGVAVLTTRHHHALRTGSSGLALQSYSCDPVGCSASPCVRSNQIPRLKNPVRQRGLKNKRQTHEQKQVDFLIVLPVEHLGYKTRLFHMSKGRMVPIRCCSGQAVSERSSPT